MSGKNVTNANHKLVCKTNSEPHALPNATMAMPQLMLIDDNNWRQDGANDVDSELKMEVDTNTESITDRDARDNHDHSCRHGQNGDLPGEQNRYAPTYEHKPVPERIHQPTEDFEMGKANIAEEIPFIASKLKEMVASSSRKLKTGTLLNFVRVMPKLPRNPRVFICN